MAESAGYGDARRASAGGVPRESRRRKQLLHDAEFPDPAVLYALANDEQLFSYKVQKRIYHLGLKSKVLTYS